LLIGAKLDHLLIVQNRGMRELRRSGSPKIHSAPVAGSAENVATDTANSKMSTAALSKLSSAASKTESTNNAWVAANCFGLDQSVAVDLIGLIHIKDAARRFATDAS